MRTDPFWKTTALEDMSDEQWESLCDGCGRCCLNKLEDWDTGEIAWTNVACKLLDADSCRCKDYENRQAEVPECINLTPESVRKLTWLPPTCGYRLVAEEGTSTGGITWFPVIWRPCTWLVCQSATAPFPRLAWSPRTMKITSWSGRSRPSRIDDAAITAAFGLLNHANPLDSRQF